jgi:hypothetical protein
LYQPINPHPQPFPRLRGKGASVADVLLNDLLLVADWLLEKVQQLPAT